MPAKPRGATPTMVTGVLLMVTTWLSTAGEPAKSALPVVVADASRPDARPGCGRRLASTRGRGRATRRAPRRCCPRCSSTSTRSAWPRAVSVALAPKRATSPLNTSLRSRKSTYIGYENVRSFDRAAAEGPRSIELHQLAWVLDRQQPQQHLVHQREDRGVGADAQTEREDDDQREARGARQGADGVSHILRERRHDALLTLTACHASRGANCLAGFY